MFWSWGGVGRIYSHYYKFDASFDFFWQITTVRDSKKIPKKEEYFKKSNKLLVIHRAAGASRLCEGCGYLGLQCCSGVDRTHRQRKHRHHRLHNPEGRQKDWSKFSVSKSVCLQGRNKWYMIIINRRMILIHYTSSCCVCVCAGLVHCVGALPQTERHHLRPHHGQHLQVQGVFWKQVWNERGG